VRETRKREGDAILGRRKVRQRGVERVKDERVTQSLGRERGRQREGEERERERERNREMMIGLKT